MTTREPLLTVGELDEQAWAVIEVDGEEGMSRPYAFRITTLTHIPLAELEARVWGREATITLRTDLASRCIAGIVTRLRVTQERGTVERPFTIQLTIAPRLSMLAQRQQCRIFQDVRIDDVIEEVLRPWGLAHRNRLSRRYEPWPYCTQYHETDLDFLHRVLAEEGIFYYFETISNDAGGRTERIVFGDDPSAYASIATDDGLSRTLPFRDEVRTEGQEPIVALSAVRVAHAMSARVRDHEPDRASFDPVGHGEVASTDGFRPQLREIYAFQPQRVPGGAVDDETTARRLEQLRRNARTVEGRSTSHRLCPGHVFDVAQHPVEALNRDYVGTRIRTLVRTPQSVTQTFEPKTEVRFDAVFADLAYPPPLQPRELQQTIDSAVVVGPREGRPHIDGMGRIRVQFRWDMDRPADEHSSCWLRVMQPWAGPNFGARFNPRVGMEVLVGYIGGDANRPVVLGCVGNSHNPPIFTGAGGNVSGFVSSSLAETTGHSEFSFDDSAGAERVVLRAERDHVEEVGRNWENKVGGDASCEVEGTHRTRTGATVLETRRATFHLGAAETQVTGDLTRRVGGRLQDHAEGSYQLQVAGDAAIGVGGSHRLAVRGSTQSVVEKDAVVKVAGHLATVVGTSQSPTSALLHTEGALHVEATKHVELRAAEGLTLTCGDASITIGPDTIRFDAPTVVATGKNVQAFAEGDLQLVGESTLHAAGGTATVTSSDGGLLVLDANASLDGAEVKLKSGSDAGGGDAPDDVPPTHLVLKDQTGAPVPNERYVVTLEDGGSRSGQLDEEGRATLLGVTGPFEVAFPGLGDVTAGDGDESGATDLDVDDDDVGDDLDLPAEGYPEVDEPPEAHGGGD